MRAVSFFRSVIVAVLVMVGVMAGASAAVAAPLPAPVYAVKDRFSIAGLHLGMKAGDVRRAVAGKTSPLSVNQPRFDYSVSNIFGREFESKMYLSKITFVPDVPGTSRPIPSDRLNEKTRDFTPPKPGIYTVEVYLAEVDPGAGDEPESVVTEIVAHFTGDQTMFNNNRRIYGNGPRGGEPKTGDYPNDVTMDLKLGIFMRSAIDHYGAPSIDNSSFVATPTWYSHCVLDAPLNYKTYQCRMARYDWCSTLAASGDNPYACGEGAFLTMNRNMTEVRLVDDTPYYPQRIERAFKDDGKKKVPPFDKARP